MTWTLDDGGRADAGFRGSTGDCVTRSIAIASGRPYREVYDALHDRYRASPPRGAKGKALSRQTSPRNGVERRIYEPYLFELGFMWTPTMGIGTGCRVHLVADELPSGVLLAACSRHLVAVVDGTIRDTHDPSRGGTRCVYGYYQKGAWS